MAFQKGCNINMRDKQCLTLEGMIFSVVDFLCCMMFCSKAKIGANNTIIVLYNNYCSTAFSLDLVQQFFPAVSL